MNIYMIFCDELRADTLGYMGNTLIQTPNIDSLAKDSAIFENSYCNTPMCVPSRLSIATGRHALSHGAVDNMLRPQPDEISLFGLLQERGYHTVNHGKWHGNIDPLKFGFDYSADYVQETTLPERHVSCFGVMNKDARKQSTYKRNYGNISLVIYGTRPSHKDDTLDSVVTDRFIDDIRVAAKGDKPLFARLSIMDPHTPYFPAEPFASMYDPNTIPLPESWKEDMTTKPILQQYFRTARGFTQLEEMDFRKSKAAYYGSVSHVDERVGKAIAAIKELGDYEDSIIMFTADHGSMMGEHGYIEKWGHMYEPVMHTPLLIKFPNNAYAGNRYDSYVESIDVLPTIFDYLQMELPESVQGKSLMPYITGTADSHKEEVYAQYYCGGIQNEPAIMVRDKKWKCTSYPEGACIEGRLLNDDPLKMSGFFDGEDVKGELYDMEADPGEEHNLFEDPAYETIRNQYLQKLEDWKASLGDIVETNTLGNSNTIGAYVLSQGENNNIAAKVLNKEGRLNSLKRKSQC